LPRLDNPKHELFAQELAKGRTQVEAYQEAGYAPSEPNASRLTSNDKVAARVAEIQGRAAIRAEITVADIIAELEQARGVALGAATPQSGAAVAASMGKAKLLGLVIDKSLTAATSVEDLLDQLDGKAG
jgi:phage terminase small subunit